MSSRSKSPLVRRYPSPTTSQYPDLRNKLSRRRSDTRSKSRSPDTRFRTSSSHSGRNYRVRSRSPARSHSRLSSKPRRSPSPHRRRSRTKSPKFRTPYSPNRRSPEYRRSSSKYPKEKSSSRIPREKSPRAQSERSSKSKSRLGPLGEKGKDGSRKHDNSPDAFSCTRRVVESSSTGNSSTVLAGVDVEPSVSKMLKKIVARTDKKKKGFKNEKLELVLRKPKKKKHKKSKPDAPVVKKEPGSENSAPPEPVISIKTEPGIELEPIAHAQPTTPSSTLQYFKPKLEVELQPILGHSKCRICKSYYPDDDDRRNHHLAQHPDRVFLVNLPVDTYYYDMEEAISHMARFGINRTELQQKVKDCNLIKLPSNIKGYSCNICKTLDTNSEKEFMSHVKEECKVTNKDDRAQHLICFCRGCHSKFSNKMELSTHVMRGPCWPSMMIINRLYDQSGAEIPAKKTNANMEKEKMIKVKQEKLERIQQVQLKKERFEEREQSQTLSQVNHPSSPFNAYTLPNTEERTQATPGVLPSSSDLQNILQNIQNRQGLQMQVSSQQHHQMDMMNLQGIQQLNINHAFNPPAANFIPPNFSLPPPSIPQDLPPSLVLPNMTLPPPSSLSSMYKVERSNSPTLSVRSDLSIKSVPIEEPSPSFSPHSHRQHSRSRSRVPSRSSVDSYRPRSRMSPVLAPPAPSQPLPTLGDLFTTAGPSHPRRSPSVESIISTGRNSKEASHYNCQWSACLWTDAHTPTCTKPEILQRCERNECDWYSKHRDYPLCERLSFYCNCKKLKTGMYKYYDDMPQVLKIKTAVDGQRDTTVMEPKIVPMRLLYRSVSRVVEDPRVSRSSYPTRQPPRPSRIFRGKKGRQGWTENDVICTWQAVSMVKVIPGNNPHIVNDDNDSDVEEVSPEEVVSRPKNISTKRRSSSQDREVW